MKRTVLKRAVSILVIVAFVALTAWYVVDNWDDFASISIAQPLLLTPVALLMIINIYASGIVIDLAIEPHGVKLKKSEAFGLANITRFTNQISPSYVAATVRAAYMKRAHQVSYTRFSSSFILSNLLQFIISGVLTLIAYLLLVSDSNNLQPLITVGIGTLLLVVFLYIPTSFFVKILELTRVQRIKKLEKVVERVYGLVDAYEVVRKYPKLLHKTVFWMLVINLSGGLILLFLYECLGFQVSLAGSLFIAALSSWSILFTITPGSIGVREGLMVAGAQIASVSIPATLLVAILQRVVMLVISGVFSLYYMPRFIRPKVK